MAIDLGDAIISILVDQSQANAQLDQFGQTVPAKMAPATTAVQGTSTAVKEMSHEMAVGQQGAVELGTVVNLAGEVSRESMYQARGEAGLLGEAFGIHLPRHVRSFIAELPGVGVALSAAFQATAILFIIDALAQAIEKITVWSERGERIAAAWEKYDQTIYTSSTHMQGEIDKQEQKLIEMTQGPVAALDFALKHLATTAFETFSLITKDVDAAVKAMHEASSSLTGIQFNVFKDAGKDLEKFQRELEKTMREAAQANPGDPFAPYKAGIEAVQQKERDLTALIAQRTAASGKDASAAVDGLHAERQAVNDMLPLLQQGIRLQEDKDKVLKQSRANDYAGKEATDLKNALNLQLAEIEKWKAGVQAAYLGGRISASDWKVAEVQAADAAAIAKEHYLEQLIKVYQRAGETVKLHAAQEELATLKTKDEADALKALNAEVEKHQKHVNSLVAEWNHLELNAVTKEWNQQKKAVEQLTKAEDGLLKAQVALASTEITRSYRDQEDAIKKLASFHLISEQQKSNQLLALYRREEDQAVAALTEQLQKEKQVMNAALHEVENAERNPSFFTDAQLLELKKNLAEATTRYTATYNQIEKTQDKFSKDMMASQQREVAQAIGLFVFAGKQKEAAQLKELATQKALHVAELATAKNDLAEAKAKKASTDAINAHIKALEHLIAVENKEEQTLEHNAKKGLSSWQQFGAGFRGEAQKNVKTMGEMGEEMKQDLASFSADLGAEFAAMLQGQESFGEAMAHATEKLIGTMAQQWGEFFAAKAIADLFYNPAAAAAEFAAAVALFTLAGVMGGLSGGGGKSATPASSGSNAPASVAPGSSQQPVQVQNVQHFAAGGLISSPTLAIVGDNRSGGGAREAILPLDDHRAIAAIAQAIAAHGGGGEIHIRLESDIPHVARLISSGVKRGSIRLTASDSIRHTKRS